MKKIIFLVGLIFLFLSVNSSFAQENLSSSSSAKFSIDYALPYPGLLPDSPFYFLHAARDRIISSLISDPLQKAEFDLLQADKRLSAGIYLSNKNKYALAATTISKGENYFESALSKAEEAKSQKKLPGNVAANLYLSSLKHQQILEELKNKTKGSLKTSFDIEEKRALDFEKEAKKILAEK